MQIEPDYLLFSSAAREVYEQNSFDASSAPPGYGLRFRYDSEWVPQNLGVNDMEGSTAIIVDLVGNVEEERDLVYTPLREVEIVAAKDFESTVYLDLKLTEGLVNYATGPTAEWYQNEIINHSSGGPHDDDYAVCCEGIEFEVTRTNLGDDPPTRWANLENEWVELIDTLCERHQEYEGGFFYRLMSVSRTAGSWIGKGLSYNDGVASEEDLQFKQIGGDINRGLQLQNDCEYEFKLSFYYPKEDQDSFTFSLTTNGGSDVFPDEIQTGFRTDMRNFHFIPDRSIHGSMDVVEGVIQTDETPPKSPALSFPVKLSPPKGVKIGFLGLFSIGLAISTGLFNPIIGIVGVIPAPEFALEKFFQLVGVAVVTLVFTIYSDYM